jgi:hypothetical protein
MLFLPSCGWWYSRTVLGVCLHVYLYVVTCGLWCSCKYLKVVNQYRFAHLFVTETGWLGILTPQSQQYLLCPQDKSKQLGKHTPHTAQTLDSSSTSSFECVTCGKWYGSRHTLRRHTRLECGKDPQFQCPFCPKKTKQKYNLILHVARSHKNFS